MVGGAKATAPVKLAHGDMLHEGKTLTGVMGGGWQTPDFLLAIMNLHRDGRFPLEKLVRRYRFDEVTRQSTTATRASRSSLS